MFCDEKRTQFWPSNRLAMPLSNDSFSAVARSQLSTEPMRFARCQFLRGYVRVEPWKTWGSEKSVAHYIFCDCDFVKMTKFKEPQTRGAKVQERKIYTFTLL